MMEPARNDWSLSASDDQDEDLIFPTPPTPPPAVNTPHLGALPQRRQRPSSAVRDLTTPMTSATASPQREGTTAAASARMDGGIDLLHDLLMDESRISPGPPFSSKASTTTLQELRRSERHSAPGDGFPSVPLQDHRLLPPALRLHLLLLLLR